MPRPPRSRSTAAALPTTFPTPAGALAAARTSTRAADAVPIQVARRRPAPARVPAAPLGSLVTATAHAGCPRCGGASVTRLAMTAPDGAPVTFVSCHTCETRSWLAADGVPLALDTVLGGEAAGA